MLLMRYGILGKKFRDVFMPRLKFLPALSVLLLSSLSCVTLFGERSASAGVTVTDFGLPPSIVSPAGEAASCPIITEQIVSMNSPVDLSNDVSKDFNESADDDETTYLVTYLVSGDEIHDPYFEEVPADLQDERDDTAAHQQLWNYFTALIPL